MDYNIIREEENKYNKKKTSNYALILIGVLALLAIILMSVLAFMLFGDKLSGFLNNHHKPGEEHMIEVQATEDPGSAQTNEEAVVTEEPVVTEPVATEIPRRGTSQEVPEEIRAQMNGKSMHENNNISYSDLRYLTIPHYDFNDNIVYGHLVVNKAVAEDVLDIFAELIDVKYPIERMELIDKYDADDYTSIDHNNTSAFNYRVSTDGSGRLSKHALGRAIDINPQINPYVSSNGTGSHSNASEYWSRNRENWTSEIAKRAYIGPGTDIYNIFIEHGWEWGGSWSSYRDYQHFQKY